jgi:hypothetical protein
MRSASRVRNIRRVSRAAALFFALALAGCGAPGAALIADVKTDLRPGIEFTTVESEVQTLEGRTIARGNVPAFTGSDFLTGQRAIEATGLSPGTYALLVRLTDRDGLVVRRTTRVRVTAATLVTVLITRDCTGVTCPGAGDSVEATECLGGRCVRPECHPGDPSTCPAAECGSDSECRPIAACAEGVCEDGVCVADADDRLCATGEWCDPDRGCRLLPGGGMDGGTCVEGAECSTGRPCERGGRECASGACVVAGPGPPGTECRAAAGPCDLAESCDGIAVTCPPDALAPAGSTCRPASGPCDVAEACAGGTAACPTDVVVTGCGDITWTGPTSGTEDLTVSTTLPFVVPGTYSVTVDAPMTVRVRGVAGGGAGGTGSFDGYSASGGGGGAWHAEGVLVSLVPAATYELTVGAEGVIGVRDGGASVFRTTGGPIHLELGGGTNGATGYGNPGGPGGTSPTPGAGAGGNGGFGDGGCAACPSGWTFGGPGASTAGTGGGGGGGVGNIGGVSHAAGAGGNGGSETGLPTSPPRMSGDGHGGGRGGGLTVVGDSTPRGAGGGGGGGSGNLSTPTPPNGGPQQGVITLELVSQP